MDIYDFCEKYYIYNLPDFVLLYKTIKNYDVKDYRKSLELSIMENREKSLKIIIMENYLIKNPNENKKLKTKIKELLCHCACRLFTNTTYYDNRADCYFNNHLHEKYCYSCKKILCWFSVCPGMKKSLCFDCIYNQPFKCTYERSDYNYGYSGHRGTHKIFYGYVINDNYEFRWFSKPNKFNPLGTYEIKGMENFFRSIGECYPAFLRFIQKYIKL